MSKIKKAFVVAGGIVGGVVGGAFSLAGKLTEKEYLDELGENIMDSTIHTGEIAGDVVSGGYKVISGKIYREPTQVYDGNEELKQGGKKIVKNFVDNLSTLSVHAQEVIKGLRTGDSRKMMNSAKTLGKVIVISVVTVGAIKVNGKTDSDDED